METTCKHDFRAVADTLSGTICWCAHCGALKHGADVHLPSVEGLVERVAMWLAHSDRALFNGARKAFLDGALRYWSIVHEPTRARWMNLARALLTNNFEGEDAGSCTARSKKPLMPGMRASIKESGR